MSTYLDAVNIFAFFGQRDVDGRIYGWETSYFTSNLNVINVLSIKIPNP